MLLHLMLTQGFDEEGMKNREKERKIERERTKNAHETAGTFTISNRKLSKMCE